MYYDCNQKSTRCGRLPAQRVKREIRMSSGGIRMDSIPLTTMVRYRQPGVPLGSVSSTLSKHVCTMNGLRFAAQPCSNLFQSKNYDYVKEFVTQCHVTIVWTHFHFSKLVKNVARRHSMLYPDSIHFRSRRVEASPAKHQVAKGSNSIGWRIVCKAFPPRICLTPLL